MVIESTMEIFFSLLSKWELSEMTIFKALNY